MIIVGDLSGIQSYIFDVNDMESGQARRLRARSFFIQALSEIALLKMREAAGWDDAGQIFCSAGKFMMRGDLASDSRKRVQAAAVDIERQLREKTGASVHFSHAVVEEKGTILESYHSAARALQFAKNTTWRDMAVSEGLWNQSLFILSGDPESGLRSDEELGKMLPDSRFMIVGNAKNSGEYDVAGCGMRLANKLPDKSDIDVKQIYNIAGGKEDPDPRISSKKLLLHIPRDDKGIAYDFDAIASRAKGAPYLGVLKMDVDSLGIAVNRVLASGSSWNDLKKFSERLDAFFTERLDDELQKEPYSMIYTVFSGGDDMLLVGPWDTVFDYAARVRNLFHAQFEKDGLTISAGMALIPRRRPINRAAQEAADLLEELAKRVPATGYAEPKDQFAAFGQIWKWRDHEVISHTAKCLTDWVENDDAMRGWVNTLLRFAEARETEPMSSSRLAYHIERNYPPVDHKDPRKAALRAWINQISRDFEKGSRIETRHLPAICKYALLATRKTGDKDE